MGMAVWTHTKSKWILFRIYMLIKCYSPHRGRDVTKNTFGQMTIFTHQPVLHACLVVMAYIRNTAGHRPLDRLWRFVGE